jgi:lactoylglutathione lyase
MTFREAFPIIYAADVERTVSFYCELLGFELAFRWPADTQQPLEFAFLRLEPLGIGIGRADTETLHGRVPTPGAASFELCVYTDDTDAAAERLRAAGARELRPPEDMPWGERLCYFADPDGNTLHITAKLS